MFFVLWILFSVAVGVVANFMNRSGFASFLMALIISPLLAVIILLIRGKGKSEQEIKQDEINKQQAELLKGVFMKKFRDGANEYAQNKAMTQIFNDINNGKDIDAQILQSALNQM